MKIDVSPIIYNNGNRNYYIKVYQMYVKSIDNIKEIWYYYNGRVLLFKNQNYYCLFLTKKGFFNSP